jgi:hypothetical protein
MVSKLVAATVSAALCTLSVMPGVAAAQEYRFSGFDAPRGITATVNLRMPLGREAAATRPSYGLTLGYGQTVAPGLDGRTSTRPINFADLRFTGGGDLAQARLASFDLAHLDRDRRLNMVGGKKTTLLIGAVIGAAIVICLAADCFDGDDDDSAN